MAELGLIASAVQLVDVGGRLLISLSQLVSNVRDAPKKILILQQEVVEIEALTQLIRANPNITAQSNSSLDVSILSNATETIQRLQRILDKLKITPNDCTSQKVWKTVVSVKKEKALEALCRELERHKSTLLIWSEKNNLDVLLHQKIKLHTVENHVDAVNSCVQRILPIVRRTDRGTEEIKGDLQELGQLIHRLDNKLDSVDSPLADIRASLSVLLSNHYAKEDESQEQQLRMINAKQRIVSKPSILQSVCDEIIEEQRLLRTHSPTLSSRVSVSNKIIPYASTPICLCHPTRYSKHWMVGSFLDVTHASHSEHSQSCPMRKFSKKTTTFKFGLNIPTWFVGRLIELTFSTTIGAGGLSISPQLSATRVIDRQASPVFILFDSVQYDVWDYHMWFRSGLPFNTTQSEIESKIKDLPRLCWEHYCKGEASPSDVDHEGQTVLHAALDLLAYLMWLDVRFDADFAVLVLPVISSIVACGIDRNRQWRRKRENMRDLSGYWLCTPLDILVNIERWIRFHPKWDEILNNVSVKNECDISRTPDLEMLIQPDYFLQLCATVRSIVDYTHCGRISTAVLQRAETELEDLIKQGWEVNETNDDRWSPLHLSIAWPTGIKILLAAGAHRNATTTQTDDGRPMTALDLAVKYQQEATIWLLLDANCALNPSRTNAVFKITPVLHGIISGFDPLSAIVKAVIDALVERRRCLEDLARQSLTPSELNHLHILPKDDSHQVLDEYATAVVDALENIGVVVPEALWPHGSSTVYDSPHYSLHNVTLDALYSAGFQSINVHDWQGFTPLQQVCLKASLNRNRRIESISWFIDHGVDPTTTHRDISWSALHCLASSLRHEDYWGDTWTTKDTNAIQCLRPDYTLTASDKCQCACTINGCIPVTVLLRRQFKPWHRKLEALKLWCQASKSQAVIRMCCTNFARLETFERLGITHVCCNFSSIWNHFSIMSQETIGEIQEEESELIEQLESWMELFEKESERFQGRPVDFLGKWPVLLQIKGLGTPAQYEEHCLESEKRHRNMGKIKLILGNT